ncbi:MAG: cell division protein ZapA [Alphaproteobacteria bacterium]|nr:cell division protein ZapA [Alphaproteobacteria bacterium]
MSQVMLTINGRSYPVACDDGQEDRIRQLGQYIDNKVTEFARKWGQIGDARLILMAGLVITDELAEMTETARKQRRNGASAPPATPAQDRDAATEAVLAAGIESLADRIEAVAARLESTT